MMPRAQVRTITRDEGSKLLRIMRRSSGSVATWRRAQMVLLSAQDRAGSDKMPSAGVQLLIGLYMKWLAHEEVVENHVETNEDSHWQMKR